MIVGVERFDSDFDEKERQHPCWQWAATRMVAFPFTKSLYNVNMFAMLRG